MSVVGQNYYNRGEMLSRWEQRKLRSIIGHSEIQRFARGEIPPDFYLDLHGLDGFVLNCHHMRFL